MAPQSSPSTRRLAVSLAAVLLAAGVSAACAAPRRHGAPAHEAPPFAPDEWRPMPCAQCAPALIAIDTRRSVTTAGAAGRYAFARVRNLNPYAVALVVAFVPVYSANGDGHVPAEYWPLRLSPAGSAEAETVLMLRWPNAVEASVQGVERY